MKVTKKDTFFEADQWFKNGDLPEEIVVPFNPPAEQLDQECDECGHKLCYHGLLVTSDTSGRLKICPGYWVLQSSENRFLVSHEDFEEKYQSLTDSARTIEVEHTINQVDVQKLNLAENDVLMITIKYSEITQEALEGLRDSFKNFFPNNKVALFAMGDEGFVKFTVASQPEPTYNSYCSDCSCGKKERAENNG